MDAFVTQQQQHHWQREGAVGVGRLNSSTYQGVK